MQYICEVCNMLFEAKPNKRRRFCSQKCKGIWLSQERKGKNKKPRITLTCTYCGRTFERKVSEIHNKNFCSKECHFAYNKNINYKRRVSIKCVQCSKTFLVKPSRAEKRNPRFCSRQCSYKWQSENLRGTHSPHWARILCVCKTCGKEFTTTSSKIKNGRGVFCSFECRVKWQRTEGANNSQWKGGKSFEPYPATFNMAFKQKIRKRDNYICAICQEKGNCVHHINYIKEDTVPRNCITLCRRCHTATNSNRDYWQPLLEKIIETRQ